MADKSKTGREVKKPKAEKNVKTKGQTPPQGAGAAALDAVRGSGKKG